MERSVVSPVPTPKRQSGSTSKVGSGLVSRSDGAVFVYRSHYEGLLPSVDIKINYMFVFYVAITTQKTNISNK